MGITNVLALLCGLALFLYGVTLLGDGLNKVAGGRLEGVLLRLGSTPLKCVLLGTAVTALIQSSTATSIIAIGFLNSGMMQISQAAYMILGSILGSSITGWIVSLSSLDGGSGLASIFSVSSLTAVLAVIGIYLRKFRKKSSSQDVGTLLLGFVVLMTGMEAMSASMMPLRTNEAFIDMLTNFSNPLLGALIGAAFTALIQSSAAAVGILQALSTTGVLTFGTSYPIILGIAVGGAIPVMLSTIGANANAKRAALLHLLMDIIGAVLCGLLYYGIDAAAHLPLEDALMSPALLALVNTVFRAITVAVLMAAVPLLEKLSLKIIKEEETPEEEKPAGLSLLEERLLRYPAIALSQCHTALVEMSRRALAGISCSGRILQNYSEEIFSEAEKIEDSCDRYEDEICGYLMRIMRNGLAGAEDVDTTLFMHAASDFERLSDYAMNIAHLAKNQSKNGGEFSVSARKELSVLHAAVTREMELTVTAFEKRDPELTQDILILTHVAEELCEEMRTHHIGRLHSGDCSLEQGMIFNDILSNYENIVDRCRKVTVMLLETAEGSVGIHDRDEGASQERRSAHDTAAYYRGLFSLQED